MVKKVSRLFAYFIFFILALMFFTPKVSIYYFLEHKLKDYDVVIGSEKLKDSGCSLKIEDADISFKSIPSAKIGEASIKIFALYNSLNIKDILLSGAAKSFVPLHINSAQVRYSIFNPLHVYAHADGEFGVADASFNIIENSVHVDLKASKKMLQAYKSTLKSLRKTKNGEFVYDKTF